VGAANVSLIDRADIQRVRLNTEPALSSVPLAGPVRAPGKCRTLRDMNREGAETFLRLLAETKLRDQLAPDPPPWAGGPGAGRVKVHVVGQALTAVGALDHETVEDVLADFDLAVSLRRLHGPGSSGSAGFMRAAVAARLSAQLQPGRPGPPASTGPPGPAAPPPPDHDPDQGPADRFVPIGLAVPFHQGGLSGELYLMSFAHTGLGARLIVLWGKPTLSREHELGLQQAELLPVGLFTVTDDRGSAYELDFTHADGSDWISQINLRPAPPDGIRWLEVAAPPGPAVRVNLNPASGPPGSELPGDEPGVSAANLSAGEQLLIMLAEELLMAAAQSSPAMRPELPALSPSVMQAMGTGLGDIIAGLEAAGLLPPLSPVPAQLAALCASLRIDGHEIAAAPADGLPEPWLSLLTYYQRRKPDTAQVRDGFAALTAALPELDGIGLALVGLHNTQGTTVLHVLARGLRREERLGPHGVDLDFPLSFWLRDNGGRWHAARPIGWQPADPEHSIGLMLVPPLPRATAWVEVLAGGRSGEVRARLPLRWGSPP
jgi:hypothetical protein